MLLYAQHASVLAAEEDLRQAALLGLPYSSPEDRQSMILALQEAAGIDPGEMLERISLDDFRREIRRGL